MRHTIYGKGGFDADKPNGNILRIEEVPDPIDADREVGERLADIEAAIAGDAKAKARITARQSPPTRTR